MRRFTTSGEVPLVGDFNGDGKDDIITFVQKAQPGIGLAPVWVALSEGNRFGPSRVWHPFFSLAGEVPMVGDVNSDGRDDILTFVQHPQANIGAAPVWVSLSQDNTYGPSLVWHTFFSRQAEIPRVADIDLDGRDDIVTFLHGNGASGLERVSFVALSSGSGFARSETLLSDFAAPRHPALHRPLHELDALLDHWPAAGCSPPLPRSNRLRHDWVGQCELCSRQLSVADGCALGTIPVVHGQGSGSVSIPRVDLERQQTMSCQSASPLPARQAGTGGGDLTNLSVPMGSRQGHVLEEVGHSIFANRFRQNADPFGLYAPIFVQDWPQGGTGASQIAAICVPDSGADYYDCRSVDGPAMLTEHIFLHHMIQYLVEPDVFRARIQSEPNPTFKDQLAASYQWLKTNWYNGLEFHRQPAAGAEIEQVGLQCGPGQC